MPAVSIELTAILVIAFSGIFWLAGLSYANKRNGDDITEIKEAQKHFAHCEEFQDLKKRVEKDIDLLHDKHNALAVEIRRDMGEMKTTLARIEERLIERNRG
jgi:hypothetical protein